MTSSTETMAKLASGTIRTCRRVQARSHAMSAHLARLAVLLSDTLLRSARGSRRLRRGPMRRERGLAQRVRWLRRRLTLYCAILRRGSIVVALQPKLRGIHSLRVLARGLIRARNSLIRIFVRAILGTTERGRGTRMCVLCDFGDKGRHGILLQGGVLANCCWVSMQTVHELTPPCLSGNDRFPCPAR